MSSSRHHVPRPRTATSVTSLQRTRAVAMPPPGDAAEATCAVCLEAVTPASKASMPCCDRDTASVSLCGPCVRFICARGPGGVGRCPKCRAHVRPASNTTAPSQSRREEDAPSTSYRASSRLGDAFEGEGHNAFELAVMRGTCRLCMQEKELVDERSVCDACAYGARFPLRHECSVCAHVQRIPHPMWRYQPSAEAFGNVAWACHGRCGDFTRWRVVAQDVRLVPPEDAPASWGTTDAWLAGIRRAMGGDAGDDAGTSRGRRGDDAGTPGTLAALRALPRRVADFASRLLRGDPFPGRDAPGR